MELKNLKIGETLVVASASELNKLKIGETKVIAAFDEYDIKKWIKNNPMDAENKEDLTNWACDEFNVEDADVDKVWKLVDQLQGNLPN